jgi:hypothetical protein
VPGEDFSKVLEQLRPVPVLGVDPQVVRIRQRLAWSRIDGVPPEDDFGLVGWPTVLADQVRIPAPIGVQTDATSKKC